MRILARGEHGPLGSYNAYSHVVSIFRNAIENGQLPRTAIHELWHSLERVLPRSDRALVTAEFNRQRNKWLAKNPWARPFLGADGELGDVLTGKRAKAWLEGHGDPNSASDQRARSQVQITEEGTKDQSVRMRWTPENYRFKNNSEYFAETMTDRYGDHLDTQDERMQSIWGHIKDIWRRMVDAIKRLFGRDATGRIFEGFRDEQYAPPRRRAGTAEDTLAGHGVEEMADFNQGARENPTLESAMDRIAGERDDRDVWDKLKDYVAGVTEGGFDKLYQESIDKYHALEVNERKAIKKNQALLAQGLPANLLYADPANLTKDRDLYADLSAYKAATFVDREATFLEGWLTNGAIAFRDGGTEIVKVGLDGLPIQGRLDILRPVANGVGQGHLFRQYSTYVRIKRGLRLLAENRENRIMPGDAAEMQELERLYPFFVDVAREEQRHNDMDVQYLVDTGRITPEVGDLWRVHRDYTPFYRIFEDDAGVTGPSYMGGLTDIGKFHKLEGGIEQIADYLENIVRNAKLIIGSGLRNVAAQRAVLDAVEIGAAVPNPGTPTRNASRRFAVVYFYGKPRSYFIADRLTFDALHGLDGSDAFRMATKILGTAANIKRYMTTHNPTFLLWRHPQRESMQAWLVGRETILPIVSALRGQTEVAMNSDATQLARSLGVGGGYDIAGNPSRIAKKAKNLYGEEHRPGESLLQSIGTVLRQIWRHTEKITEGTDLGVRTQILKAEMAAHGNRFEAAHAALRQGVNFRRHGANPLIRLTLVSIPFLGARIQGMDAFVTAAIRRPRQVWPRVMLLVALASLYYFARRKAEDYMRATTELRDANFLFNILGYQFALPIPFEAGILFKTLPEHFWRAIDGSDIPQDSKDAITHALVSTLGSDAMPALVAPAVEVAANHSFYTGRTVVDPQLEGLKPSEQYNRYTSETAKAIGRAFNVSPQNVDHLLQGYFSALGEYASFAIDSIVHGFKGGPVQPAKHVGDYPFLRPIVRTEHNIPSAQVQQLYQLKREVDELVKTVAAKKKERDIGAARSLLKEEHGVEKAEQYVKQTAKKLSDIRALENATRVNTTMTAQEKRDRLDRLDTERQDALKGIANWRRKAAGLSPLPPP